MTAPAAYGSRVALALAAGGEGGDCDWKTLHGVHVCIGGDGTIAKGPASFVGKSPGDISEAHGKAERARRSAEADKVPPRVKATIREAVAANDETKLNEFRRLAKGKGIDAESVIDHVRGQSVTTAGTESAAKPPPGSAPKTEAFKAWFGDSKVVDAKGEPRVVYHGTASEHVSFDPSTRGSRDSSPDAKHGFFFSTSADSAGEYTYRNGEVVGNIKPVYLSIKNPGEEDAGGAEFHDLHAWAKRIEAAKAAGHDGYVIRNFKMYGRANQDIWVAFEPNQIKSATGNRGTFDPKSNDITLSAAFPSRIALMLAAGGNCGTGAGGFSEGNTCASGGGGTMDAVSRPKGAGRTTPPGGKPKATGGIEYVPPKAAHLKGDSIFLWHGTTAAAGASITKGRLREGSRGLNASADVEHADQYPEDTGAEHLVLVKASPKHLAVDPNDQQGETVEEGLFPRGFGSSATVGKHEVVAVFDVRGAKEGYREALQSGDFTKAKKLGVKVVHPSFKSPAPAPSGGTSLSAAMLTSRITLMLSAGGDCNWRTIEGTHVCIGGGGKITKGPAALVGKAPGEVGHPHELTDAELSAHEGKADFAARKAEGKGDAAGAAAHRERRDELGREQAYRSAHGGKPSQETAPVPASAKAGGGNEPAAKPAKAAKPEPKSAEKAEPKPQSKPESKADANERLRKVMADQAARISGNKAPAEPAPKAEPKAAAGKREVSAAGVYAEVGDLLAEKYTRHGLIPLAAVKERLTEQFGPEAADAAETHLKELRRDKKIRIIPSEMAGSGGGYVEATDPADARAAAASRPRGAVPDRGALAAAVVEEAHAIKAAGGGTGDFVPIHAIRDRIAQRFGPDAARHGVLNDAILQARKSGDVHLTSISDTRGATAEQLDKSITNDYETYFYLTPKKKSGKSLSASVAPSRAALMLSATADDDWGDATDEEADGYDPEICELPAGVIAELSAARPVSRILLSLNCGTGAGGFAVGNTCGKGRYGRSEGVRTSRTTLGNIRKAGAVKTKEFTDSAGRKVEEHTTPDGRTFHAVTHASGRRSFHSIDGPAIVKPAAKAEAKAGGTGVDISKFPPGTTVSKETIAARPKSEGMYGFDAVPESERTVIDPGPRTLSPEAITHLQGNGFVKEWRGDKWLGPVQPKGAAEAGQATAKAAGGHEVEAAPALAAFARYRTPEGHDVRVGASGRIVAGDAKAVGLMGKRPEDVGAVPQAEYFAKQAAAKAATAKPATAKGFQVTPEMQRAAMASASRTPGRAGAKRAAARMGEGPRHYSAAPASRVALALTCASAAGTVVLSLSAADQAARPPAVIEPPPGMPAARGGQKLHYRKSRIARVRPFYHLGHGGKEEITEGRIALWASAFDAFAKDGTYPYIYPRHLEAGEQPDATKTLGYVVGHVREGDDWYSVEQYVGDEAARVADTNGRSITIHSNGVGTDGKLWPEYMPYLALTPRSALPEAAYVPTLAASGAVVMAPVYVCGPGGCRCSASRSSLLAAIG